MEQVLRISGMHCTACSGRVERALTNAGAQNVRVDLISGKASFDALDVGAAKRAVEALGFSVATCV